MHKPGEPARVGSWEQIGPDECPLMYRRTFVANRWFKVLWHEFMPNASDEAHHDHPRSFVTFVLRGGYLDEKSNGIIDSVHAPAIRYRSAEHAHITHVGSTGATTLVVMGPPRREWGFWQDGKWFQWRTFEKLFGLNWRCPD